MGQVLGPVLIRVGSLLSVVALCWRLLALGTDNLAGGNPESPEVRAVAYLAREVPSWSAENGCYSCHNNGDGARALYLAVRQGYKLPSAAIEDTTAWLAQPRGWDQNGGAEEFSDKKLARIQFTSTLVLAVAAGQIKDRTVLLDAAQRMAEDQQPDGGWPSDATGSVGSPITYGRPLATAQALLALRGADPERFRSQIAKASRWIDGLQVRNTMEAAAVVLNATSHRQTPSRQLDRAVEFLRPAQSPEGGWGPFANAPPEIFDTALVVLALAADSTRPDSQAMAQRGRDYLIANQLPNGGWAETTRPPGAESYAQRISTTAWATIALLATKAIGSRQ